MARYVSTAYGPPWGGIQGGGTTATGIDLHKNPKQYVVAVDPSKVRLGSKLRVWPNPFGDPNIVFTAADTGGAIKGNRLDFYDWRGRKTQLGWGKRDVSVQVVGRGSPKAAHSPAVPVDSAQSVPGAAGASVSVQDNPQALAALQSLLSAPSGPAPQPAAPPPPTAQIASAVMPAGYAPPPQPQTAPQQPSAVDRLLQAAASVQPGQVNVTPGESGSGSSSDAGPAPSRKAGVSEFDGKPVAKWIAPILEQARKAGWKGTVNSGYRSVEEQARIYNSGVRPAAKPGQSNHNFTAFPGGAVDVSDAPQLAAILKRMGVRSLQWAGSKDPVHFSHPRNGTY